MSRTRRVHNSPLSPHSSKQALGAFDDGGADVSGDELSCGALGEKLAGRRYEAHRRNLWGRVPVLVGGEVGDKEFSNVGAMASITLQGKYQHVQQQRHWKPVSY